MVWYIVLAVWLIASVLWWHSMYKEYGFLRVCDIYQGFFSSIPAGIVKLYEYLDEHWRWWNYPLFTNKELKESIDFLNNNPSEEPEMIIRENGKDIHFTAEQIKKLGNELIEEVKTQAIKQNEAKNETRRKLKKKTKNKK